MKRSILKLAMALSSGAVSTAFAGDLIVAFDPLTVRAGEEMRITLFNPTADPIVVRVFAYDAAGESYDEGPSFTLAPGKVRFFDFKAPNDFVGLGGVIETMPDSPTTAADPKTSAKGGSVKPMLILEDILVSSVKSRGSLQHRTASGQSQTMGYSFGATQTGSRFKSMGAEGKRVTSSRWVASPEY